MYRLPSRAGEAAVYYYYCVILYIEYARGSGLRRRRQRRNRVYVCRRGAHHQSASYRRTRNARRGRFVLVVAKHSYFK